MSEKLHSHESMPRKAEEETTEIHKKSTPEDSSDASLSVEQAREKVEKTTESKLGQNEKVIKQTLEEVGKNKQNTTLPPTGKDLKAKVFRDSMRKIQNHLSVPNQLFSKIVHQRTLERASDVAEKTLVRPSGILGGGIFALLGSIIYIYITKFRGYTYNYLLFVFLFVGGFLLGLLIELVIHTLNSRKHKSS